MSTKQLHNMEFVQTLDAAIDPAIDPRIRPFLRKLNENKEPFWELPGDQVRSILSGLQAQTPVNLSGITIDRESISVDGREVLLYIIRPEGVKDRLPVLLFVHGGVWKAGNFENHQRLVRDLAVGAGVAVVFVEYTPIPDAIFPVQLNESYAAAKWIYAKGAEYNLDNTRLAVGGNSVGGNMSAALSIMAKDNGDVHFKFQLLLYPAVGADFETWSYNAFSEGRFLTKAFMEYGYNIYAPDAATRKNRYCVPMEATVEQLKGLPAALIQTAENDPLRDEGEAYGRKLTEAGVDTTITRYIGMIHDFALLNGINGVPAVQSSILQATAELSRRLNR